MTSAKQACKAGVGHGWTKVKIAFGSLFAGTMAVAVACFLADASAG